METKITPALSVRGNNGKENLSPVVFKNKRQKHDDSAESLRSPVPIRARPLQRIDVNLPAWDNLSFVSSVSSTTSLASSTVRKRPLCKQMKSHHESDISDITYMSSVGATSCNESSQSSDATFATPKKMLPLRAKRRDLSAVDVSFEDSINESVTESFKLKKLLGRKNKMEEYMDISYKSSSQEENLSSVNTSQSDSLDISLKKKRPLRASPRNHPPLDVTYMASPELSLEIRKLPLEKLSVSFEGNLSDITANNSITEQLRYQRDSSVRNSKRLDKRWSELSGTESTQNSLSLCELALSCSIQASPTESLECLLPQLPAVPCDENLGNSLRRSERLSKTLSSSQDGDSLTPSKKRRRPLSVAPLQRSIQDVSFKASQNPEDSLSGRQLPLAKKSNPAELSVSTLSSRLEAIRDESFKALHDNSQRRSTRSSTRSLTPSQDSLHKRRPLKKSSANKTMGEASYLPSPGSEQESLKLSHRLMVKGREDEISFAGFSYNESLTRSLTLISEKESESEEESQEELEEEKPEEECEEEKSQEEKSEEEREEEKSQEQSEEEKSPEEREEEADDKSESDEEEPEPESVLRRNVSIEGRPSLCLSAADVSLRRSTRSSARILTPSQESNLSQGSCVGKPLPLKKSSVDNSIKETSYLASQESEQETFKQNRTLMGKGSAIEVSFAGFSYQESLIDSTTRSDAQISEKTSDESTESEDEEESREESVGAREEPETVLEMRNTIEEESLSAAQALSFNAPEALQTNDGPNAVRDRVRLRIEAIIKAAKENVVKKFERGCQSPDPIVKPRKQTAREPVQRQKTVRPKLYKPAPWANKRLYDYLGQKLEPHFGMQRMVEAEKLVKIINETVQIVEKNKNFQKNAVNRLKLALATDHIIETTDDFYRFIRSFLSRTCEDRMIPCLQPFTNIVWPPKDDLKREWENILD